MACLEVAGRVSFYQSGWVPAHRWRNSSTLLLARIIDDACQRGFTEVDLLRGDEPYKRGFASAERQLLRLRAAHGPAGHAALAVLVLASRMRRLASRALAHRGLPRLRRDGRAPAAAAEAMPQRGGAHHPGLGAVDER
jgi:hypothetical protein